MLNSHWKISSKTNNFQFFLVILFFVGSVSAQQKKYDFENLFNATQKNSPEYKKLKANVLFADAELQLTTSKYYPRLGLEYRHEQFKSKNEDLKGSSSNVYAEWSIFNGFRDVISKSAAESDQQISNSELVRFEKNFKLNMQALYSKAYASQKSIDFYNEAISLNHENLKSVSLRKSSGLAAESDYLEFELFDSKLKTELIAIISEHEKNLADLKIFSGIEDITVLISDLKFEFITLNVDEVAKKVNSESYQIQQSQRAADQALRAQSLARAQFLPEVSLKATYGSLGLRETVAQPETTIGLATKWELFSGFETLGQQKVHAARVLKTQSEFQQQKMMSKNYIRQTVSKLNAVGERLNLDLKNPMSIEKYLKVVRLEYRRGVKNSTDLKSATELALQASISRALLKAEYFQLILNLEEINDKN